MSQQRAQRQPTFNQLPDELWRAIGQRLDKPSARAMSRVSRRANQVIREYAIPEGKALAHRLQSLCKRNDIEGVNFLLEHRRKQPLEEPTKEIIGSVLTDALVNGRIEIMWRIHDAFGLPITLPDGKLRPYSLSFTDHHHVEVTELIRRPKHIELTFNDFRLAKRPGDYHPGAILLEEPPNDRYSYVFIELRILTLR
jgi:hypothetical protein